MTLFAGRDIGARRTDLCSARDGRVTVPAWQRRTEKDHHQKRLQELRNKCRDHYNVVADGVLLTA